MHKYNLLLIEIIVALNRKSFSHQCEFNRLKNVFPFLYKILFFLPVLRSTSLNILSAFPDSVFLTVKIEHQCLLRPG